MAFRSYGHTRLSSHQFCKELKSGGTRFSDSSFWVLFWPFPTPRRGQKGRPPLARLHLGANGCPAISTSPPPPPPTSSLDTDQRSPGRTFIIYSFLPGSTLPGVSARHGLSELMPVLNIFMGFWLLGNPPLPLTSWRGLKQLREELFRLSRKDKEFC